MTTPTLTFVHANMYSLQEEQTLELRFENGKVSTRGLKGTGIDKAISKVTSVYQRTITKILENHYKKRISIYEKVPTFSIKGSASITVIPSPVRQPPLGVPPIISHIEIPELEPFSFENVSFIAPRANVRPTSELSGVLIARIQKFKEVNEEAELMEDLDCIDELVAPPPCSHCGSLSFDYCPGCNAPYCSKIECVTSSRTQKASPPVYNENGVIAMCRNCNSRHPFSIPAPKNCAEESKTTIATKFKTPASPTRKYKYSFVCSGHANTQKSKIYTNRKFRRTRSTNLLNAIVHSNKIHASDETPVMLRSVNPANTTFRCSTGECLENVDAPQISVVDSMCNELEMLKHLRTTHGVLSIRATKLYENERAKEIKTTELDRKPSQTHKSAKRRKVILC